MKKSVKIWKYDVSAIILISALSLTNIAFAEEIEGGYGLEVISQTETLINHLAHDGNKGRIPEKIDQISKSLEKGLDSLRKESKSAISKLTKEKRRYKNNPKILERLDNAIKKQRTLLARHSLKITKKIKAIKGIPKTLSSINMALNIHNLVDSIKNAYQDIESGNAEVVKSFLPVAEAIISFDPVSAGLVHIKNEADKLADLNRGIGERYREVIDGEGGVLTRYFRQYHVLAKKGFSEDKEQASNFLRLYKEQREKMLSELDVYHSEVESALPFSGKSYTLERIREVKKIISSPDIEEKQKIFVSRFQDKYQARQDWIAKRKELNDKLAKAKFANINNLKKLGILQQEQTNYKYSEYTASNLSSINETETRLRHQNTKRAINEKYEQKIQAERAAKRRQDQERIKQKIRKINQKNQAERATSSGAGRILSAADSLRLGGNYAYGVAFNKGFRAILRPYRNQSAPLTKNDGNKSASLFFDGLEEITPNAKRFSERVKASSEGYGDYNHTAWGAWSGGQNTRFNFTGALANWFHIWSTTQFTGMVQGGYWIYGQRPGIADIPKAGSARYVGQLMGDFWTLDRKSSIQERGAITGDIKMAVTFQDGNNSIFGSLNLKRSGADWATASFNTLNARSAPNAKFRTSDHFSTLLDIRGGSGRLTGSFFGANAAEAGGAFGLDKDEGADRGSAIGVFRAKNVGSVVGNVSDADRLRLLSGNYALATYIGGYGTGAFSNQGSPYDLSLRSGSSNSLTLRFPGLKESIPNSDPAKSNTLIPSDRIKVHARDYGDYSYVAWGAWSSGKNTRIRPFDPTAFPWWEITRGGHWIYGQKSEHADIPRSGSARYAGQIKGAHILRIGPDDVVEMNSITGDINMAVTFRDSNFSLIGAMNIDRNGEDWATARFNNPNATTHYETLHLQFGANLSMDGYERGSGYMEGSFFGANAAEAGGTFYMMRNSAHGHVHGVFRAKKQ